MVPYARDLAQATYQKFWRCPLSFSTYSLLCLRRTLSLQVWQPFPLHNPISEAAHPHTCQIRCHSHASDHHRTALNLDPEKLSRVPYPSHSTPALWSSPTDRRLGIELPDVHGLCQGRFCGDEGICTLPLCCSPPHVFPMGCWCQGTVTVPSQEFYRQGLLCFTTALLPKTCAYPGRPFSIPFSLMKLDATAMQ